MRYDERKDAAMHVLYAMESAAQSLSRSMKHPIIPFESRDWSIGRTYAELATGALDASTIAKLSDDRCRLERVIELSRALMTSASQLLDVHERKLTSISLKLSKGLDTLPDELLAAIIGFATLHEHEGTRQTIKFSLVSRRFRGVCLGDCRLWSNICLWGNMKKKCIETCISRSGTDSDLHITFKYGDDIDINSTITSPRDLAGAWSSSISRWRSLALVSGFGEEEAIFSIGMELERLMRRHGLSLPRLRELSLIQCQWPLRRTEDLEERSWLKSFPRPFSSTRSWDTPELRGLRCVQYIPPPSFPFTSFTTFSLSLALHIDAVATQIRFLLKFLSRQTSISSFKLELDNFKGCDYWDYEDNIGDFVDSICPALTTFDLKIIDFDLVANGGGFLGLILRFLSMPRLECFSFTLDIQSGWDADFLLGAETPGFLLDMDKLVPNPDGHPNLASLRVSVRAPPVRGDRFTEEPRLGSGYMTVNIPLDKIPRVTSLYVTTNTRVQFSGPAHPSSQAAQKSRLEELHLRSCENLTVDGLCEVVQSLKDAATWEALKIVVIKDCESLDFGSALEIIGKERLRFEK